MLHYQPYPQTDPMMRDARALGVQLSKDREIEDLRRRYELVCLVLAFSACVNVGVIVWLGIEVAREFVSF